MKIIKILKCSTIILVTFLLVQWSYLMINRCVMSDSWRTLIVLAMHNTADREAVYVRAIKWWLDHSAFDLLVLDSAGRGVPAEFHMPRVHTVTFDQRFFEPPPGPSPTKWELLSLSTPVPPLRSPARQEHHTTCLHR